MTVTDEPPPILKLDSRGKRRANSAERSELYLRSGGHCEYCGATLNGAWEVEHAYPADVNTPLYAACAQCNRSKGARPLDEWAQMHADDWWLHEQRWCWSRFHSIMMTDEYEEDIPRQLRVVAERAYQGTFQSLRRLFSLESRFKTPERSQAISQRLAHLVLPRAPIVDAVMRRELADLIGEMDRRGWLSEEDGEE